MSKWNVLSNAVREVIYANGNREITGQVLQNALLNIISNLGNFASFAGMATPSTNPGTPDGPVYYFATQAGTYTNFGALVLGGSCYVLYWNGTAWSSTKLDLPTTAEVTSAMNSLIATESTARQQADASLQSAIAALETITVGKTITTEDVSTTYTKFRDANGGRVKITCTAAHSHGESTFAVYIKESPSATTYTWLGPVSNVVGATAEFDLSDSEFDGLFYIKNDFGATMDVEWVNTDGSLSDEVARLTTEKASAESVAELSAKSEELEEDIEDVTDGLKSVREIVIGGESSIEDITEDANFTLRGYWINNGSIATSSWHKVSNTMSFNKGDTVYFKCKTESGAYQFLIFKSPTEENITSEDLRTFVGVGTKIKSADGTIDVEYKIDEDCYLIFESSGTPSLKVKRNIGISLIDEVTTVSNALFGTDVETITTEDVSTTYTKFRDANGGRVKITCTAAHSHGESTFAVYIKESPSATTYTWLGPVSNVVGATAEFDLSDSEFDGLFYIKNDFGATMDVEWVNGDSNMGLEGRVEILEQNNNTFIMPFNGQAIIPNKEELNVLTLGNSFSETMYSNIVGICSSAGIGEKITFARTYSGGASLEQQCGWFDSKDANREFHVSVNGSNFVKVSDNYTIQQALAYKKWDIIIIHEKSERSGLIEYYNTWLPKYVSRLRSHPNTANARIVMQLTWALGEFGTYDYLERYYKNSQSYMFDCLKSVYAKLKSVFGMDWVIPNHLSLQNARVDADIMSIADINDLLAADGIHPNTYGRYIASATFFQCVIAPLYGKTIMDNAYSAGFTSEQLRRFQACAAIACAYNGSEIGKEGTPTIDQYLSLIQ